MPQYESHETSYNLFRLTVLQTAILSAYRRAEQDFYDLEGLTSTTILRQLRISLSLVNTHSHTT